MDLVHWDDFDVQAANPDCKIDDSMYAEYVYNVVYTGEEIFVRIHGYCTTEEQVYNQEISVDELAAICGTGEHSKIDPH